MNVDTQQNRNFAIKNLDNLSILHFGYGNMAGVKVKKVDSITSGTAEIGLTDTGLKSNLEYASASVNPRDVVVTLAIEDDNKRDVYDDLQDILYKGAEIALFVGDDFLDGHRGKCGVMKGIMSDVSANRFKKGLQDIQYTIHCVEPYWYDIEDYDIFTKILESWFARAERLSTISFETSFSEASTFALADFKGNVEDNAQIEVLIDVDSDISGTLQIGNPSVDDELIELDCPVNDGKWPKKCTVTVDTNVGQKLATLDYEDMYDWTFQDNPKISSVARCNFPNYQDNMFYGVSNGVVYSGDARITKKVIVSNSNYGTIVLLKVIDNDLWWVGSNKWVGKIISTSTGVAVAGVQKLTDSSNNVGVVSDASLDKLGNKMVLTVGGVVYSKTGDDDFRWCGTQGTPLPTTWTFGDSSSIGSVSLNDVAFGNGKFIAVGRSGKIVKSEDGITWSNIIQSVTSENLYAIGSDGGNWFVVGGYKGILAFSSDGGATWEAPSSQPFGSFQYVYSIACGPVWVAVGTSGKIAFSANGSSWTFATQSATTGNLYAVAYGGGKFVAGGIKGVLLYSTDGMVWEAVSTSVFGKANVQSIAYGSDMFIATADSNKMAYSRNGLDWTLISYDFGDPLTYIYSVGYGNGVFVAGSDQSQVAYSQDGVNWTGVTVGISPYVEAIVYGGNRFVGVGSNTTRPVCYSNEIKAKGEVFEGNALSAYARSNDFVIVTQVQSAGNRTAYLSKDLQTIESSKVWGTTASQAPAHKFIKSLNGLFFGISYGGSDNIYKSNDGWTWTASRANALLLFQSLDDYDRNSIRAVFSSQTVSLLYQAGYYDVATDSWNEYDDFSMNALSLGDPRAFALDETGKSKFAYTSNGIYARGLVKHIGVPISSYWINPTGNNGRTLDLVLYPAVMGNSDIADKISVAFPNGSGKRGTMKITVKVLERWL